MTINDMTPEQRAKWDEIAASNEWWDGIDEYAEMAFESFVRSIEEATPETPDRDVEFTAVETAAIAEMNDVIRDNFDTFGMEYETRPNGTCSRCAGTGQFITYVENNVPKGPGGICFRCEGKGVQTRRDYARNIYHDAHMTMTI